jgi:hypothetical protein
MSDDKLRAILSEAKAKGASEEQLVQLIKAYQGSKKKDSTESPSTSVQEPTSSDSQDSEITSEQSSPFSKASMNRSLAADMAAFSRLERVKNGELDKAPRTEYERYKPEAAPEKIENEQGELVDPRYVTLQREKAKKQKEADARALGFFDGVEQDIDPSAAFDKEKAAVREGILENIDRAKRGAKELQDTKLGEQLGIDTEAPSKLEEYNGRLRKAQQIITELDDMKENGVNLSGQYHAYSKTTELTKEQVDKFTQQAINDVAELLDLSPEGLDLETLKQHVDRNKNYTEGVLFERTIDRAAYKEATESVSKDFTFTRTATLDAVLNLGNQAAIAAYDAVGNPVMAERYQQKVQERSVRASLELGHDLNDSRGAFESMQDGEMGLGFEKLTMMAAQSWLPMATAILNPTSAIAYGAASGGLGTYEAYRDRGDLTEEEKFILAFGSATAEGVITAIGMGNVRRARAAAGIADDVGKMSSAARRKSYAKAMEYLEPHMKKVSDVLKNPAVRGAATFTKDVAEEQIEELSIAAVQQGLAYAIANDEFDKYEFADTFLSTLLISSPTSGITGIREYSNYSLINAMPSVDKMNDFEALKTQYTDLKSALKSSELDSDQKKIIRDEMKVVKTEINKMKAESLAAYESLSEEDQAAILEVNSDIKRLAALSKKTENATAKAAINRQLQNALDKKSILEKKALSGIEATGGIQAETTTEEGVTLSEAQATVEANSKAKAEAEQAAKERLQKPSTPKELVNKRVRYTNPVNGEIIEGTLAKDGQRLVLETEDGQIMDIGNFDELADQDINEVKTIDNESEVAKLNNKLDALEQKKQQLPKNIAELRERVKNTKSRAAKDKLRTKIQELKASKNTIDSDIESLKLEIEAVGQQTPTQQKVLPIELADETAIQATDKGTFTYNSTKGAAPKGTEMKPINGLKSIKRDKNGNIKRVVMTSLDGSETYNLKGQDAEDAAYQLYLQDMSTPEGEAKVNAELEADAEAKRILEQEEAKQIKDETKTEPKPVEEAKESTPEVANESAEPTVQQTDRIRTEGDVKLSDKDYTTLNRVLSALGVVVPNMNIVMHSSRKSYNKTHANANKDVGHYNPNTNTIHLLVDGKNPLNTEGWLLLKHEAIHPVLDAILANDPAFANLVEKRVKSIMNRYANGTDAQKRVLNHADRYKGRSDQALELLTEFINVFSQPDGMIMLSRDKTAIEKVRDLLQSIVDRIMGFRGKPIPASEKSVMELVRNINDAFSSGRQIDVKKTKTEVAQEAIRQSLRRDTGSKDPVKNAISPKKGEESSKVLENWVKSNSNFIIAEDFEHSLELRRMGFVESHQMGDGKIVLSVPQKYESYNASTNVVTMTKDSFLKPSDLKDLPSSKNKVHGVLSAFGKFTGAATAFVDREDLGFTSALIIPDSNNGLDKPTVVVNLANANERTGASGFSMHIVETLRRKATADFNKMFKDIINGKGKDSVKSFFEYSNIIEELSPFNATLTEEDRTLIAIGKMFQEAVDRVINDVASDTDIDMVEDIQSMFSEVITEQTKQNGELVLTSIPFGENFVPALNALFVSKEGINITEDTGVTEKEVLDRLIKNIKENPDSDSADLISSLKGYNKYLNRNEDVNTPLDVFALALNNGYIDFDEMTTLLKVFFNRNQSIPTFEIPLDALDKFTKDFISFAKLFSKESQIDENLEKVQRYIATGNTDGLTDEEISSATYIKNVVENLLSSERKSVLDSTEKGLNLARYQGAGHFVKSLLRFNHIESAMLHYSPSTSRYTYDGFGVVYQLHEIFGESDLAEKMATEVENFVDRSALFFQEILHNAERKAANQGLLEELAKAKTIPEALKMINPEDKFVFESGVFDKQVGIDVIKKQLSQNKGDFPNPVVLFSETVNGKKIKYYGEKGMENLINNKAVLEINIANNDGFLNISYSFKGEYGGYYDYPASWNMKNITMPLVFEHVNTMGAILNAKGIKFGAIETGVHSKIPLKQYSQGQIESFKNPSAVLRRGLNNITAIKNGHMVDANASKDIAFIIDDIAYKSSDRKITDLINKDESTYFIKDFNGNERNRAIAIGVAVEEAINSGLDKLRYRKIEGVDDIDAEIQKINSVSIALDRNGEMIPNNAPMRSAFENSEKYVAPAAIRSMLTPDDAATGRKAAAATDKMFENAEEIAMRDGRKKVKVKEWFSREALVDRSAKLKKAMEKGLADYIEAQFTDLKGVQANADKQFHKIEKKIFGGLNTTEEILLDKIVLLRRIIQIDTNWDNRLQENKIKLAAEKDRLSSLRSLSKAAKTEAEIKSIKKDIKSSKEKIKYFSSNVDKYSTRPKHPSDGTMPMNVENAVLALKHYEAQMGTEQYQKLNERANMFFDQYKQILEDSYKAGLIDEETRDRFINDDYSPRVFLNKMFGEADMDIFDAMNLGEDQIQGIQEGSDLEIFTDIRFLLNASMRSIRNKEARNELYSEMDRVAAESDYKNTSGFMRAANYERSKKGEILEDGYGNRKVKSADNGFVNVYYREGGKVRAFQIAKEFHGELTGTDQRKVFSKDTKKAIRRFSGVTPLKMFATGIKPVFALVASIRLFSEVTRGRGVYDQYKFLPYMQVMAMVDFFKGLKNAVMDDADVEDYFAHGGGMTFLTTEGRPDKIYKRKRSTARRLLGKYSPVKGAIHVLAYAGEKAELGGRIAIYKRALETIKKERPELTEKQQKYLAVKEARLIADFSQGGWVTKDLDVLKPYINAAVQGTRGTVDYIKSNPKMFVSKAVQAYIMNGALTYLAALAADDDEYDKIPAYIKNRYNLIPTFIRDENGKMYYIRIPKPHQFMFLDHFAKLTGESFAAASKGKEWSWDMYAKNDISGTYLTEDGHALADALLGSIPIGDIIPDEILTPARMSLGDVFINILTNIPTVGAFDAYTTGIDRYRNRPVTYDFGKMHPLKEGYKDDKTRDIYKFLTGIYNSTQAPANTVSAPRLQAAVEKLITNESNSLISLVYNLTDMMIRTDEEKEGIELLNSKKKEVDRFLGLKRTFIYTAPDKSYNINQSKLMDDIDKNERGSMNVIKKDLKNAFKNADYKLGDKLPKDILTYIKGLDGLDKGFAAAYAKNMASGFEIEPIFIEVKYSANGKAAAAKLKLAYGFNSWDELPKDVKEDIGKGLSQAGFNWRGNKEFLASLK